MEKAAKVDLLRVGQNRNRVLGAEEAQCQKNVEYKHIYR